MSDVKRTNGTGTGSPPPKRKKRRRINRFYTMLLLLVGIAGMLVATVVMRSIWKSAEKAHGQPAASGETASGNEGGIFSIKKVTVAGDTRYQTEDIVQASGIYVGQSIWSVDKKGAIENILRAFPYIETAAVANTAYDAIEITVTETEELGAMYADGQWLVVGTNGKALEALPVEGDRPMRYLYFKGATPLTGELGKQAMDDRSLAIAQELVEAFETYGLTGVCEIDMTNKSDIRLNWNNRITVKMGNDSQLTHEVGVVVSMLPGIEEQYGSDARGQIDASAYSSGRVYAVFTPEDLLGSSTTTGEGSGGTTTTTKNEAE